MRYFALLFALILLGIALPAAAQTGVDPADFVPANAPLYLEVASDEASLQQFQSLFDSVARMSNGSLPAGTSIIDMALNPAVNTTFPNVDVEEDIFPWLAGNHVGMVIYSNTTPPGAAPSPTEYVLALPIGNAELAQAFFSQVATEQVSEINNIALYEVGLSYIASSDEAIWIGSPAGVEQAVGDLADGVLSSAAWYNNVKSQLPADALVSGYMSGEWVQAQVAQYEAMSAPETPSFATILEAALRIHPAESEMEDAFLQFPDFVGAGFTMDYADGRLDITAAAAVDAAYAAPTLTTETAGTGLLDVIPADSVVVYDTYDGAIISGGVGGLAVLGPAIGQVFDNIVFQLENPGAPTPTPTPMPPPTADELIAQAQPMIAQAEQILGITLPEFYGLINGEFAVAVFPPAVSPSTENCCTPSAGAALWLQTSDPARLMEVIEQSRSSLSLLMANPFSPAPEIEFETQTINGVEVTAFGTEGMVNRPVYGIVNNDILFVTTEDSLDIVLNAASDDVSITQTRAWHNDTFQSFGSSQEALLFIDMTKFAALTSSPYSTAEPPKIGQFIATADVADNGVFLLHISTFLES